MTKPSITHGHGFLDDMTSLWGTYTSTADSGNTTTTVDAENTEAEDFWNGFYIKYKSGANAGLYRLVTNWVAATHTMTHLAFPNGVSAGDVYVMSSWVEGLGGMANGDATPSIENSDVFKITATFDDASNEYVYYRHDFSPNLSSNIYTKYLLRWKTSASEEDEGAGALAYLIFTDASSQCILGGASETPQFSTTWQVASGTITTNKTVYRITLQADDYPNSVNDGPYYVYFDFILLHRGTFTLPFVDDIAPTFPEQYIDIPVPGRQSPITQYVGSSEPVSFRLSGKIDIGASSSWGVPPLEYFYRIWKDAHKEPWQWFSTGGLTDEDRIFNGKVTLRTLPFVENKEATRSWSVVLKQYSLSALNESVWDELQGLGV